ncbi:MAG: HAMP domain-containing protein, partial [Treponema sp.]|nr:HAMP domain-containing protein [Treponema sp.]
MRIKRRILLQTLSASAAFTLLVALMFFLSMANIRSTVLNDSSGLGDSAAAVSAHALEEEVTKRMIQTAAGTALFLNEYIERIENHTRMTADIAGTIYTRSGAYHPHPLPRTMPGQLTPAGPYLHVAPGARPSRAETDLAGNIEDALRQITVVDRGITTSTIGGESGYVIAMDIYPWPQADFDPRETPWYRGAKERGGLYWTAVYADLRGRGPAVSCAVPFYDRSGGKAVLRGVARSTVMLADMAKLVDSAGDGGSLFVLDGTGRQLFSGGSLTVRAEGPEIAGENYLEHSDRRIRSLAVSMTLGAGGVTVLPLEGVLSYAAYAPVESLGWSVAVAVPVQEVNAPAWLIGDQIHLITEEARADMDRRIIFFTALASLLVILTLLLTAFFSVRFTGAITRPILVLSEGVREVSGGNLDREVSVKTGDELEELALSFNAMTGRLREHIGEIARIAGERQRIETELDVAARIQMNMLPYGFPPFPGRRNDIDLYAAVHPAKEVGGDFYDFFFIDDERFAFTVADVSGKGVPAALFMAITKALLRNHLQGGEDPGKAL